MLAFRLLDSGPFILPSGCTGEKIKNKDSINNIFHLHISLFDSLNTTYMCLSAQDVM